MIAIISSVLCCVTSILSGTNLSLNQRWMNLVIDFEHKPSKSNLSLNRNASTRIIYTFIIIIYQIEFKIPII